MIENILTGLFIILWAICIIFFGIPELYKYLGGSTGFYFLLPLVVCVNFKYRALTKLLWSITLTLIGLITINALHSYFSINHKEYGFFTLTYVVSIPLGCVMAGYVLTVQSFLVFDKKEDIQDLGYFGGFLVAVFLVPLLCVIPYLDQLKEIGNINNLGYQIGLGVSIISGLVFLIEIKDTTVEMLNYLAKPLVRFGTTISKARKILFISVMIFLAIFSLSELNYRGHWIIWIETVFVFIIYILVLYKFGKILFEKSVERNHRLKVIYLPSIKSKRTAIIGAIFITLYLAAFFIISGSVK